MRYFILSSFSLLLYSFYYWVKGSNQEEGVGDQLTYSTRISRGNSNKSVFSERSAVGLPEKPVSAGHSHHQGTTVR
jgi:hypothetical protein